MPTPSATTGSDTAIDGETTSFEDAHRVWHDEVEERRAAPYGPLSVTSLEWLSTDWTRFDGVPGRWRTLPDGTVEVSVDAGEHLEYEGSTIRDHASFGPLSGIEAITVASGPLRIEVAARGGAVALRPRDPGSPARLDYAGTPTFPAAESWVVTARFVPAERPDVAVDTVVDGIQQHYASPGVAEFEIVGRPLRLTLFPGPTPGSLRALFADATGADATFPAARAVEVRRSDADTLVIDFNRATNPPCAYSAHATCPLPPSENRLPVRIEAGELRPRVLTPPR
jgi:uncharacterized protein (DUF1684 family)